MAFTDRTDWLQERIDKGGIVEIPDGEYLVSRPLRVGDHTRIVCTPRAHLRLADGANCPILMNVDCGRAFTDGITIEGGVWDGNNLGQQREKAAKNVPLGAFGQFIVLTWVRDLVLRGMTIKDPESFAVQLTAAERFTIEGITFDFNKARANMDGIHVNGFARDGLIRDLKGETHDDMVALNSDEGEGWCDSCDIENVTIENVYGGLDGWTGVRLLSRMATVRNVAIRNLYGGYKLNGVSFTHWGPNPDTADYGRFENVLLDGIYAFCCRKTGRGHGGIVWFQPHVKHVGTVVIKNVFRTDPPENPNTVHTVEIGDGVSIDRLVIRDLHQDVTGDKQPIWVSNTAKIKHWDVTGI